MIEIYQIKLGQYNHRRTPPKFFGLFNVSQVCQLTLLPFLFNIPRRVIVPRGFFISPFHQKYKNHLIKEGYWETARKSTF